MLLRQNLNAHFIIFVRFWIMILLWICSMDLSRKYTKELRRIKVEYRKSLFPYVTKFMDQRIDSYLSLFYECELYSLDELCRDLTDLLYNKQSYSVVASIEPVSLNREPIYKQLTLF